MADGMQIHWDKVALGSAIGLADEVAAAIEEQTSRIAANAQAMSASFRTGIYHDHATGEKRGDTPTQYVGDVQEMSNAYVGIVYTGNYSAQKDNMMNNTLLKAM